MAPFTDKLSTAVLSFFLLDMAWWPPQRLGDRAGRRFLIGFALLIAPVQMRRRLWRFPCCLSPARGHACCHGALRQRLLQKSPFQRHGA